MINGVATQCILAATSGVISHVLYFNRGEKDLMAYRYLQVFALLQTALSSYVFQQHDRLPACFQHILLVNLSYFIALFGSITLYRVVFHKLGVFPGPRLARVTKAYGIYMSRDIRYYEEIDKLHQRFGSIVRVGPNEILCNSVEGLIAVHGPQSNCTKGSLYGILHHKGTYAVAIIRDKVSHQKRRKVWDQAFTSAALKRYEPRVQEAIDDWIDQLRGQEGKPINISYWSKLLTFDMMGDVGYSKKFGAVKKGGSNATLKLLEALFRPIGLSGRWAWPLSLAADLGLGKESVQFADWATKLIVEREQKINENGDISAALIQNYNEGPKEARDHYLLESDSQAIMIAATDTITSAVTWIFYELAKDCQLQSRLRQALQRLSGKNGAEIQYADLAKVPLLNGIIHESMRLHSAVTIGGPRTSPPEGIMIGKDFIPGGVNIFTPHHSIHTNEKYFVRPLEYIPERWTTSPELIIDKRAFAPFLLGPFGCVGKQLALMQLRLVVARTVCHFNFGFAEGEDGKKIETKSQDLVILSPAELNLTFQILNS